MDEDKSRLQDKLKVDKTTSQSEESTEHDQLQQQLSEQKEKYLRLLAEMENARKRMQKEKHDTIRFAIENVIREFLTPLDHFKNAMNFVHKTSEETQNWAKGFEMILTQFKDILLDHQVTPFESEGKSFDPHLHEVIEMEETQSYQAGTVIQEFLCGYRCGDRILRPARVKVSKQPTEKEPPQEKITEEEQQEGEHQS